LAYDFTRWRIGLQIGIFGIIAKASDFPNLALQNCKSDMHTPFLREWVSLIWTFNYAISRQTGQGYIQQKNFELEEKLFAIIFEVTVIWYKNTYLDILPQPQKHLRPHWTLYGASPRKTNKLSRPSIYIIFLWFLVSGYKAAIQTTYHTIFWKFWENQTR
jgi:hypothetical protein